MRVILKKSVRKNEWSTKVWPVNQVLVVTQERAQELITSGAAVEYKGEFPPKPKHKVKMDLAQLKN